MAFGLYIHWPYCESKCPYCDFNSHVANRIDQARWISAYRSEIARVSAESPDSTLGTIFFGGGTPSLMSPDVVAAVIDAARSAWRCANALEITLEANPSSVEAGRLGAYRDAGVNRVSLGIQALNDADLRLLGRKHDRAEALRAIETAQFVFDRVNLDLMYGRQYQSVPDWTRELAEALQFGTTHLSLYQLTIEEGTVFGRRHAAGQLQGLPDEDRSVAFFEATQALCDAAGLSAYEISNHARPGQECRHNLIYWQAGTYAGIGPGAHGRLGIGPTRRATEAIRDPAGWLTAVETRGNGDVTVTPLSPLEQAQEVLLMGLRLSEGVSLQRLEAAGIDWRNWMSCGQLLETGLLERDASHLRTSRDGRLLLNAILRQLCSDLRVDQT
ncbi:MAG: radical SAM family heme chaperone HemW [Gemmobacter sp.]|uniref:radical SAM family heme chaperone HemW n=1 Tax=Gemmobacter sp. TaxID=1898957 RepID=UPI003919E45F